MKELSATTLASIDRVIERYPDKRSTLLPLLHLVQEDQKWVSPAAMEWIAEKLDLKPIEVYEVATFYPMFKLKPIGRKHIKVCRTLPCALKGAYKTCENLSAALNCEVGGTSEDGEFTIEFVECIADCGFAPVVQVDDKLYENVAPESVDRFVEGLRDGSVGGSLEPGASAAKDSPEFKG